MFTSGRPAVPGPQQGLTSAQLNQLETQALLQRDHHDRVPAAGQQRRGRKFRPPPPSKPPPAYLLARKAAEEAEAQRRLGGPTGATPLSPEWLAPTQARRRDSETLYIGPDRSLPRKQLRHKGASAMTSPLPPGPASTAWASERTLQLQLLADSRPGGALSPAAAGGDPDATWWDSAATTTSPGGFKHPGRRRRPRSLSKEQHTRASRTANAQGVVRMKRLDARLAASPYIGAASKSIKRDLMVLPQFVLRNATQPRASPDGRDHLAPNFRLGKAPPLRFGGMGVTGGLLTLPPGMRMRQGLAPYRPTDGLYDVNASALRGVRRELKGLRKTLASIDAAQIAEVYRMLQSLPLEFLLQQGGIYAEYVRNRCIGALKLLFAGVWENTTAAALEKWKALVRAQRAEEAKRIYRFNKAKKRLRDTMRRYFARIQRGRKEVVWEWWTKRTVIIRDIVQDRASRTIQRNYRGYVGRTFYLKLLYKFKRETAAAEAMQTWWRCHHHRRIYAAKLRGALKISPWWRCQMCRFEFWRLKYAAIRIQATYRCFVTYRWYQRLLAAAEVVQNSWRGAKTRRLMEIMSLALRQNEEEQWFAATQIQRVWRGHMGRQIRRAVKDWHLREHLAVVRLQCRWYKRNNQFTAFLLMRCLILHHEWDVEAEQEAKAKARSKSAAQVQALWRSLKARRRFRLLLWRHEHCVRLQAWWRGVQVRRHIEVIYAAQREAARRHRAAFAIQRTWWFAKPGRLLWHLRWRTARKLEMLHMRRMARLIPATLLIQRNLRMALTRRLIHKHRCAVHIQARWRRIMACRRVRALRHAICVQFTRDVWHSALAVGRAQAAAALRRTVFEAATLFHTQVRGHLCRKHFRQKVLEDRAARSIQGGWAAWKAGRIRQVVFIKLRRHRRNMYKDNNDATDVARRGVLDAAHLYNPWAADAGIHIAWALRRFGMPQHAKGLTAAGITCTRDLVRASEADLRAAGVTQDAELHQLKSLVDAFKLGLIAPVAFAPQPDDHWVPPFESVDTVTHAELEQLAAKQHVEATRLQAALAEQARQRQLAAALAEAEERELANMAYDPYNPYGNTEEGRRAWFKEKKLKQMADRGELGAEPTEDPVAAAVAKAESEYKHPQVRWPPTHSYAVQNLRPLTPLRSCGVVVVGV